MLGQEEVYKVMIEPQSQYKERGEGLPMYRFFAEQKDRAQSGYAPKRIDSLKQLL